VPMLTTAAASELLSACRGQGVDKEDFAVIYHTLARLAGIER
jgi:hypothetical protein